ncbi:hypothetical protein DYB35_012824 [Aphanomyces astaci]|uniref:DDE-1 domain-containing protein n=1 Tax=Aphanomyces astaci TaxID=112090 RepID=A0A3R7AE80_APHAT|nr:hypothetical protein DYB35_012824 [Aphanomyces astaci]
MSYLATKKSDVAYDSLLRLLRRFCQRYGFSRQRQTKNKLKQAVLTEVHDEFARDFHRQYQSYENNCVFNVDETGMYYNLPPTYIWAVRGGSAKISMGEKHSMRMTAVLTARADGQKLPLLLIMKGVPEYRGAHRNQRVPNVSSWPSLRDAGECVDGCGSLETVPA